MSHDRTSTPFMHSEARLRTTWGTLGVLAGLLAAGVTAWASVRADVDNQRRQLAAQERRVETLENRIAAQSDVLSELRADMKILLRDRGLTDSRR